MFMQKVKMVLKWLRRVAFVGWDVAEASTRRVGRRWIYGRYTRLWNYMYRLSTRRRPREARRRPREASRIPQRPVLAHRLWPGGRN